MAGRIPQAEFLAVRDAVLDAMTQHSATGYPPHLRCQCGLRYDLEWNVPPLQITDEIRSHVAAMITESLARHVGLI